MTVDWLDPRFADLVYKTGSNCTISGERRARVPTFDSFIGVYAGNTEYTYETKQDAQYNYSKIKEALKDWDQNCPIWAGKQLYEDPTIKARIKRATDKLKKIRVAQDVEDDFYTDNFNKVLKGYDHEDIFNIFIKVFPKKLFPFCKFINCENCKGKDICRVFVEHPEVIDKKNIIQRTLDLFVQLGLAQKRPTDWDEICKISLALTNEIDEKQVKPNKAYLAPYWVSVSYRDFVADENGSIDSPYNEDWWWMEFEEDSTNYLCWKSAGHNNTLCVVKNSGAWDIYYIPGHKSGFYKKLFEQI